MWPFPVPWTPYRIRRPTSTCRRNAEQSAQDAEHHARDDIGGVVDPQVNAREAHGQGPRAGDREKIRVCVAEQGGDQEGGRGVAGREAELVAGLHAAFNPGQDFAWPVAFHGLLDEFVDGKLDQKGHNGRR